MYHLHGVKYKKKQINPEADVKPKCLQSVPKYQQTSDAETSSVNRIDVLYLIR